MMERCLELARQGVKQGELPFGAVIAFRGQVIAEATNHVSSECDVTRHAELVALSEAQKILRQKRLPDCTLYSIVEPCPMCSFPAREARIGRVVFAISSPIMGGFSRWDVLSDNSLSSKLPEVFGPAPEIVSGLLSQRAEQVWRDWNPLAWRFMRRRGCFGRAAEQTSCHAGAPRPTFSWNALADILAAPALSSCAGVQIQTPSRTWTSLESEIGSALLQDQARVAIVSSARVGMGTRSREHRCGKPK